MAHCYQCIEFSTTFISIIVDLLGGGGGGVFPFNGFVAFGNHSRELYARANSIYAIMLKESYARPLSQLEHTNSLCSTAGHLCRGCNLVLMGG